MHNVQGDYSFRLFSYDAEDRPPSAQLLLYSGDFEMALGKHTVSELPMLAIRENGRLLTSLEVSSEGGSDERVVGAAFLGSGGILDAYIGGSTSSKGGIAYTRDSKGDLTWKSHGKARTQDGPKYPVAD